MSARQPIIAANWKMHLTHLEAIQNVQKLSYLVSKEDAERVEIVICPPASLPRTSSGKPQRRKTREMYLDGTLARARSVQGPVPVPVPAGPGEVP